MNLPIMFNNQQEIDFLLNSLKSTDIVLEWGSGGSTLEIGKRVKWLYSVEHDERWYEKVKNEIKANNLDNVILYRVPRNKEEKSGDDGTYEDYKDYVNFISSQYDHLLFDVIFIDGRARVECAKVALQLLKDGGVIFIHDYRNPQEQYRRYEYEVVEEFLEPINGAYALWKFKKKK